MKRVLILLICLQTVGIQARKCVVSGSSKHKLRQDKDRPETKCYTITCTNLTQNEHQKLIDWAAKRPNVIQILMMNDSYLWNNACVTSYALNGLLGPDAMQFSYLPSDEKESLLNLGI